jgi:folate-binding protein YgfZ
VTTHSPLNPLHQQAEASFLKHGEAMVVETFGEIEGEYAALRKGCVLLDLPQRGTIRIGGKDRIAFLNRMVTQEVKDLKAFRTSRTFWLNRKGRIEADLRLIELPAEMWADVDVLSAAGCVQSLASFVIAEEVEITDVSEEMHRLALHGPTALSLLRAVGEAVEGPPLSDLMPGQATIVRVAGQRVTVDRSDTTGEAGLELLTAAEGVPRVYEQFLERGLDANGSGAGAGGHRMRPAGWHAYNIARIEAGTPLFNIDYGPESLPAETGILEQRVSFTKGCYLGQEVVARMNSLGHPKQALVGLRVMPRAEQSARGPACQPVTGARVFREGDADRTAVGAVTSSARSPMLGDAIGCFAPVKWGAHEAGTRLAIETEAGDVPAVVIQGLAFWGKER